jgi:DNA-binding NarL/FixJ family response regulator
MLEENGTRQIRIMLLEDQASFRQALAFVLDREPNLSIVAQAGKLEEARKLLNIDADVAIVDLVLSDGSGVDFIEDLHHANPRTMILVLSASLDRMNFALAVEAGASGVLDKLASIEEIVDTVKRLYRGEILLAQNEVIEMLRFLSRRREENREGQQMVARLTPREREVLQAVADGLDTWQVAEELHITPQTERNHMAKIFTKLGVHSRLQALVFAARHGVVKIRQP